MLSKIFRLNLREQEKFFSSCFKIHSPYFSLFYKQSQSFQTTVIVSKKIASLATQRNSIKRKYRSALTQILSELQQVRLQIAIVVHEKGTEIDVPKIIEQIQKNVQKIRT